MTFCLGMKVKDGLVGIADTRVTSGTECIRARKISTYFGDRYAFFMMTSGLRSVRDKSLTYFEEALDARLGECDRLFKAVNLFAEQVRRVAKEDREALMASGLHFNIHTLIGGQMAADKEHKLFLLYPEGNWVEVGQGTPYHIIGASGYGKPVLDRTLKYTDPMRFALKVGCLAFDSTRISAADVDFPIDVVLYPSGSFEMIEHRFEKQDLADMSAWWQERLRKSVSELPENWMETLLSRAAEIDPRRQIAVHPT
ncbi:MAG: peptidase [Kiritimatiellae bacterium]|nr:peptidase [Kiritimatiellia bacterium]MDW8459244.1 peptidase [Verrucomicrobiota bacterium]